jgi:23S rRNA (cytosine1962-C5)-methyltransferase
MVTLTVKQNKAGPVMGCHPWIFSEAFTAVPEGLKPGDPVMVRGENGRYLASGYFSSYSQITVRLWGFEETEAVDGAFFVRRIEAALRIRRTHVESADTDSYRLINGENDLLPGLIVDKYADWLVVQFHTRGITSWREKIIDALNEVVNPAGIYERSDVPVREYDDLGPAKGVLTGVVPEIITIRENGFRFLVNVREGQKTGFFLDQRDKRRAFGAHCRDSSVLNCFSYTGGFSVYALAGGARHVLNVDTSEAALDMAKENVRLNGFDGARCSYVSDDVKRYLRGCEESFDAIVLDPPAFIKDRRKKHEGIIGYRNLNEAALHHLRFPGILLTCSCSAHLSAEEFRFILSQVGGRLHRPLRILESFTHGIDHLQLVPFTEGQYLKAWILSG